MAYCNESRTAVANCHAIMAIGTTLAEAHSNMSQEGGNRRVELAGKTRDTTSKMEAMGGGRPSIEDNRATCRNTGCGLKMCRKRYNKERKQKREEADVFIEKVCVLSGSTNIHCRDMFWFCRCYQSIAGKAHREAMKATKVLCTLPNCKKE